MEESKRYVRLGIFVFLTLTIVAAILFILGGRSLFAPHFTFETYFDQSVAGLEIGAPVKFRGVPMGQVTEIVTSAAEYESNVPVDQRRGYIVVRATVTGPARQVAQWRREAAAMTQRGLRAQTQLAGITGQQYLALDRLDPQTHPPLPFSWKPKHVYVPSSPSLTLELIANTQKFIATLNGANVEQLAQNLNKLIVTTDRKVDELPVAELSAKGSALLASSRVAVDRLNVILRKPEIDDTLHNLASASGGLRRLIDSGEIDHMGKSIDDLAQRLGAVVGDNQYDLRAIVADLRSTAANLRVLSETLKRYPAGTLIGGPPEKVKLAGKSQ